MSIFSKSEELSPEDKLIAAKVQMLMSLPFFGNLASGLNVKSVDWMFDKDTPVRAATDGVNFFYNPEGIKDYSISELVWLYAHEVSHVCWQHFIRQGERNQTLWNIATDYAINGILRKNKIGKPIKNTLDDERFDGMHAEQIYEILYKEAPKLNLDQLSKMLADKHLEMDKNEDGSPKSEEEINQLTNKIKEDIIKAAQSTQAGSLPVGFDRLIESITNPQLPWQEILRDRIKSKIKTDFSFMRPNRRNSNNNGIIFPSMTVEDHVDICIGMDMSGSIGDDTANEFMSEIYGIISEFKSWSIRIWSFDTQVYNERIFSSDGEDDILSYKPKGGGGTDFECNWKFMKKNDIEPKLFIMFTDLYPYGSWGDPDYCDTLFIGYGGCKDHAPFGETIHMNK
jgi:predicted metal-dependent peptidase